MTENAPFFVDREIIILTRNGVWLADGTEISHEPTRRLFARSLKKRGSDYILEIGRETKKIEVEDTAYFVQRLGGDFHENAPGKHAIQLTLKLNDETEELLDPRTLVYRPGRLTCRIKGGTEEAKFLHAPYFELLKNLEEDESGYFLNFGSGAEAVRVVLGAK